MYPNPKNYVLELEPNFSTFTFKGKEILQFHVLSRTDSFYLDCEDIEIHNVSGDNIQVKGFEIEKEQSRLTIQLGEELLSGTDYELEIEFTGQLNNGLAGWYRSKYMVDGEEKYLASSQFEAADARRAFPCVDHPSYKASYDIHMILDQKYYGISNTDMEKEEKLPNDKKKLSFVRTPVMSTYLVYFGVGEFEYLEDKYNDVIIRGFTTVGKKEYTRFALECAKKSLAYFEEYFGYKYPLPKLDLLAIPDFAVGAMENWGAVTFRETAILYYPDKTSISRKNYIAEVVAHELAHQWFGNLVTMKWWNDLWLNESFATFMAYKAINHYWKEWDVWTQYVGDTVFGGMELDSLQSSHPIQVEVNHANEIDELFDAIAYDKGGSILRMLEGYLGEEKFRDGLRAYIQSFAYQNAEGRNLWETLEQVAQKPVTQLMQKFIEQVGFPVLSVEQQQDQLYITQERFTQVGAHDTEQWEIPLVIDNGIEIEAKLMKEKEKRLDIVDSTYVNLNKDYTGFYITKYSDELYAKLGANFAHLSSKDRLGIMHDLYNLTLSTQIKLTQFTGFVTKYLSDEKEPAVLDFVVQKLTEFYGLLPQEPLKVVLVNMSKKAIDISGLEPAEDEGPIVSAMRNAAFAVLAQFEDQEVLDFTQRKFDEYQKDNNTLHANLRSIVYSAAVGMNDQNYDVILSHYRNTDIQDEMVKFLSALGNTKNPHLINQTLDFVLTPEVRFSNLFIVFISLSHNIAAKDQTIRWIITNWDKLVNISGGMSYMILRRVLQYVIPNLGIGYEEEIRKFAYEKRVSELGKTFDQVLEKLSINSRFVEINK